MKKTALGPRQSAQLQAQHALLTDALALADKEIESLRAIRTELHASLAEAKKAQASAEQVRDHHKGIAEKATEELEQLHSLLDAIPGSPVREVQDEVNSWIKHKRSTVARLCALFATRSV